VNVLVALFVTAGELVATTVPQPLSEHTWKVSVPVSPASASENVPDSCGGALTSAASAASVGVGVVVSTTKLLVDPGQPEELPAASSALARQ